MGIAPALVSLHYHTARLRGAAGHTPFVSWANNAKKVEAAESTRPFQERVLQRVTPLNTAIASLTDGSADQDLITLHIKRLKRKYRAPADAAAIVAHEGAIRRLLNVHRCFDAADTQSVEKSINGLALAGPALAVSSDKGWATASFKNLLFQRKLAQAVLLEGFRTSTGPAKTSNAWDKTARTFQAHHKTLTQIVADRSPAATPGNPDTALVDTFATSTTYSGVGIQYVSHGSIDSCGMSHIDATGSGTLLAGSLATFLNRTDPCGWCDNIPETFKASSEIDSADLPLASIADVPAPVSHQFGAQWNGYLFEIAAFQLFPSEYVTEFRNVLNVDFEPDANGQSVKLTYSLYESLTSAVLGKKNQGGIDIDSGTGEVTIGAANRATVTSDKSIRFSAAAPYSQELNAIALPWLVWWMKTVVVGGLAIAGT